MNRKIYYNLTQIDNGWLLNCPDANLFSAYAKALARAVPTIEKFYNNLAEALETIKFIQSELESLDRKNNSGD